MIRRNKQDYPHCPSKSWLLRQGPNREYYRLWQDFLSGQSSEEPPEYRRWLEERKLKRWHT